MIPAGNFMLREHERQRQEEDEEFDRIQRVKESDQIQIKRQAALTPEQRKQKSDELAQKAAEKQRKKGIIETIAENLQALVNSTYTEKPNTRVGVGFNWISSDVERLECMLRIWQKVLINQKRYREELLVNFKINIHTDNTLKEIYSCLMKKGEPVPEQLTNTIKTVTQGWFPIFITIVDAADWNYSIFKQDENTIEIFMRAVFHSTRKFYISYMNKDNKFLIHEGINNKTDKTFALVDINQLQKFITDSLNFRFSARYEAQYQRIIALTE
jgi:hypothetical protein